MQAEITASPINLWRCLLALRGLCAERAIEGGGLLQQAILLSASRLLIMLAPNLAWRANLGAPISKMFSFKCSTFLLGFLLSGQLSLSVKMGLPPLHFILAACRPCHLPDNVQLLWHQPGAETSTADPLASLIRMDIIEINVGGMLYATSRSPLTSKEPVSQDVCALRTHQACWCYIPFCCVAPPTAEPEHSANLLLISNYALTHDSGYYLMDRDPEASCFVMA